jgi:hypothetical protein
MSSRNEAHAGRTGGSHGMWSEIEFISDLNVEPGEGFFYCLVDFII